MNGTFLIQMSDKEHRNTKQIDRTTNEQPINNHSIVQMETSDIERLLSAAFIKLLTDVHLHLHLRLYGCGVRVGMLLILMKAVHF